MLLARIRGSKIATWIQFNESTINVCLFFSSVHWHELYLWSFYICYSLSVLVTTIIQKVITYTSFLSHWPLTFLNIVDLAFTLWASTMQQLCCLLYAITLEKDSRLTNLSNLVFHVGGHQLDWDIGCRVVSLNFNKWKVNSNNYSSSTIFKFD